MSVLVSGGYVPDDQVRVSEPLYDLLFFVFLRLIWRCRVAASSV